MRVLADRGLLGPRTSLAHAVWLDERDLELLAETRTTDPRPEMAATGPYDAPHALVPALRPLLVLSAPAARLDASTTRSRRSGRS